MCVIKGKVLEFQERVVHLVKYHIPDVSSRIGNCHRSTRLAKTVMEKRGAKAMNRGKGMDLL